MTEKQLKEIESVASWGAYHGAEEDVVALVAEVRRLRDSMSCPAGCDGGVTFVGGNTCSVCGGDGFVDQSHAVLAFNDLSLRLSEENSRLREALSVYANPDNWWPPGCAEFISTDFCDPRDSGNEGWELAEEALGDEVALFVVRASADEQ